MIASPFSSVGVRTGARSLLQRAWARWIWPALLAPLCLSCSTGGGVQDLDYLARFPPIPYKLALGGGAILPSGDRKSAKPAGVEGAEDGGQTEEQTQDERVLAPKTFAEGVAEPISFDSIRETLIQGRVASGLILLPSATQGEREALAMESSLGAGLGPTRQRAEEEGADLILVLEGLKEAPILVQGVTNTWPVAGVVWLLVGLGGLIPDTRFESRAVLKASLRDVYTGRRLMTFTVTSDPMDLSLFQRAGFWKIVSHIIIPPPLVGSDQEVVAPVVREEVIRQLKLKLVARLKSEETREQLLRELDFRLELVEQRGRRVELTVQSHQEVKYIEIWINGKVADDKKVQDFRTAFYGSRQPIPRLDLHRYHAVLSGLPKSAEVRVLVLTLAGQRVSSTLTLER